MKADIRIHYIIAIFIWTVSWTSAVPYENNTYIPKRDDNNTVAPLDKDGNDGDSNGAEVTSPKSTKANDTNNELEMYDEGKKYSRSAYKNFLLYEGVTGSSVSVVSLFAHLALFFTGSEPKNLPKKNLASLAVSLLLGNMCFVVVGLKVVSEGDSLLCKAFALGMQFGFSAGLTWMFVISADVWIVLYEANKKLRVAKGKRKGRFAVYSAFAWFVPAAVIVLQLFVVHKLHWPKAKFQDECWFWYPESQDKLFMLPISITIIVTNVMFIGTVRLIATSGDGLTSLASNENSSSINQYRNNLKIYMRLSLMVGLTWVFLLAGSFTNSDVFWTLSTAFNTLQGAFIFLAFDCNWNAVRTLPVIRQLLSVPNTQTCTTTKTTTTAATAATATPLNETSSIY